MTQASINDALELVAREFRGMTDKDGAPYVTHCLRVMMGVQDPLGQQVALMHDLVEDTPLTLAKLKELGFAASVVDAVALITHHAMETYTDYVVRLKANPLARAAKLSDLRDNASLSRVLLREDSAERDLKRIQKYILSYQFLEDRIGEAEYRRRMEPLEG